MAARSAETPAPETLYAAALYLATSYAKTGCPMVCRMLVRQLECILSYPDELVPAALRDTCRKLHAEWEHIGAERMRALHAADALDAERTPRMMH